jgi:RHS repeat-associated protein
LDGQVTYDVAGRVFQEGFPTSEAATPNPETTFTKFPNLAFAKTLAYDVLDRVHAIQTPDNNGPDTAPDGAKVVTTTFDYSAATLDGTQRLIKMSKDPLGKVKTDYLSPRGDLLAVVETNRLNGSSTPTTLTTRYTYDPLSQLTQVQDANGNVTTASYDTLGHMVKLVSPDAGQTEWRHFSSGLLAAKETANLRSKGQLVSYVYDVNRLKQVVYPTASENVTYTYGAHNAGNGQAGRIASVQDESGTEVRFYDQLGNVSQMQRTMATQSPSIPGVTYTMSYSFDTLGRVLNMTYPDGEVLTYGYDAGGNPITATGVRKGTTTNYVTNVQYNQLGQRQFISLGNGSSSHYFFYTDTKRLQSVVTTSGTTQLQNIGYGYDLVGNLTGVSNNLPTLPPVAPNTVIQPGFTFQTFGYDDLYQLTSAAGTYRGCACGCNNQRFYTLTMQYDGIGNISRKTQNDTIVPPSGPSVPQVATTYDNVYKYSATSKPHAPTTIGTETITYDNDGNMQGTNGTFGPSRAFTWTEDDRLRTETDSGFTNTYLYDADGTRTHKRRTSIETWYVNPFYVVKGYTTETKHIMIGDQRVASQMATMSTYTNPSTAGTGTFFYYHPDHLQSTSYTTGSDGSILQHDEYFATGETWISESKNNDPRNTQPWMFNAKELDETGLYQMGARYYNPKYSIWSSPDPILASYMQNGGEGAAPVNLGVYSYSYNNPVVLRDPTGMSPEDEAQKQGMHKVDPTAGISDFKAGGCASTSGFTCLGSGIVGGKGPRQDLFVPSNASPNGIDNPTLNIIGKILDEHLPGATLNPDTQKEIEGGLLLLSVVAPAVAAGLEAMGAEAGFSGIGATGKVGEKALESFGGESQVYFETTQGGRYVDQLVSGIAHESKVGYTSLTKGVAKQIAKDSELIRTRQIGGATWHFFRSPVTGAGGPSAPLRAALKKAGIGVVVYP